MRSARDIAKGPAPETDTGDGAARATTRACAFILAALVAAHLVFLFHVAGDSPVWPTAMFDLQDRLGMPVAVSHGQVGLVFAILGVLLAVLLWRWASRLAALIFAVVFGWEVYFQALRLWPPILMDQAIPQEAMLSAGLALLGLITSLTALFAGFAFRIGRRRAEKSQSERAEAMALRIRARR